MPNMKALVVQEPGEQPTLAITQVEVPSLKSSDVLVEVAACGMCYHDVAVMQGVLRRGVRPGGILGHEISGTVAQIGGAVSSVSVGDRVVATLTTFCGECERCSESREYRCLYAKGLGHALDGGFAQFVRLPQSSVVPVPDGIELQDASILACPIGVGLQAVQDVARLKAGETALVTGAGGGLGVHVIQIAASLGARVLAVTTSPEKVERIESIAPCEVILADELDFSEIALALTEDQGADVVIDTVGSAVFRSALRSLGQFGRMVLLGEIVGERANVNLAEILFRDATISGSTGASPHHIATATEMVGSGRIKPIVSHKFALDDALAAYQLMRDKKSFGRVVLVP